MLVGNFFVPEDRRLTRRSAGHDFLAFYTAGNFARSGWTDRLYDVEPVKAYQRTVARQSALEINEPFGPFWNPPVFAWVFAPLAKMSYSAAWWTWFAFNVACAIGAAFLLCTLIRDVRGCTWRQWGLVPLLLLTSMPFIQALGHAQNTCISLLLVTAVVWLWQRGWIMTAGLVCGMLFYKPQLAALLAGVLVLLAGWRALVGLSLTGAALLTATLATMPGMLTHYLDRLPRIVQYMQVENRYMWERHVTLKAFWRLLLQGYETGPTSALAQTLWIISAVAIAAILMMVIWNVRRMHGQDARVTLCMAGAIMATPLLMPFYFDYDLLLLAVPAVLTAREQLRSDAQRTPRWLWWLWIATFVLLFVNPAITGRTHVNLVVLLVSGLALLTLARALRRDVARARKTDKTVDPPRALAA